jgi:hypothetical protein
MSGAFDPMTLLGWLVVPTILGAVVGASLHRRSRGLGALMGLVAGLALGMGGWVLGG